MSILSVWVFYCSLTIFSILPKHLVSTAYDAEKCAGSNQAISVSCQTGEILRIDQTILNYYTPIPGQPEACNDGKCPCDYIDFQKNCHVYSNQSDIEFVGRQSASSLIPSEDLQSHPERQGPCENSLPSNVAKVYYECIPEQSTRLQSLCDDILWEDEMEGFLVSPYFPRDSYPEDVDTILDCKCELRPDTNSRIELLAVLINPSSAGITWTVQLDAGTGYNQELSGRFYVSQNIPVDSTGTVSLRFQSQGTGAQRATRVGPPVGFWIQYKAVSKDAPLQFDGTRNIPGRATLYCNYPEAFKATAGFIVGVVIGSIVLICLIVLFIWWTKKRKRKSKSYRAGEPYSNTGRTNNAMSEEPSRSDDVYSPHHTPRQRISTGNYSDVKPPNSGRPHSNSYSDKVFFDEVDKKSLPSSGQTGDNDSFTKKSLSTDSQLDNYSDVNYSPKLARLSSSIGRDTAV